MRVVLSADGRRVTNFEYKPLDATANPHLALAAIARAPFLFPAAQPPGLGPPPKYFPFFRTSLQLRFFQRAKKVNERTNKIKIKNTELHNDRQFCDLPQRFLPSSKTEWREEGADVRNHPRGPLGHRHGGGPPPAFRLRPRHHRRRRPGPRSRRPIPSTAGVHRIASHRRRLNRSSQFDSHTFFFSKVEAPPLPPGSRSPAGDEGPGTARLPGGPLEALERLRDPTHRAVPTHPSANPMVRPPIPVGLGPS